MPLTRNNITRSLIVVAISSFPLLAHADPLELVCDGVAVNTASQTTFGSATTGAGETVNGSATTYGRARSTAKVRLQIANEQTAAIKLPPALIPPVHSGGVDSWWPIADLAMSDMKISGTFRLNFINKGRFVVDRHTGDIEIVAFGSGFTGSCQKAQTAPAERLF